MPSRNIPERRVYGGSLTPVYIADTAPADEFEGQLPVDVPQFYHVVSSLNSSSSNLLANNPFIGTGESVLGYTNIVITLISDVPSAAGGFEIQFSYDGSDWEVSDQYTYEDVGVLKTYTIQRIEQYFRVVYTNGSSDQTHFHLRCIFNTVGGIHSSHRVGDVITDEDDAQLTKAVLSGRQPNGEQINIDATPGGELKTSVVTAVGSLPISQLTTLRDGKILNRLFPENDEIVGTGTGTYQTNKYNMSVTSGQWLVYQSRRFHPYFSGKPQKVELTFDNFQPEANVVKRVGYFSSSTSSPYSSTYDGFYLESSNGTISFVIQRAGTVVLNADITTWTQYESMGDYSDPTHWSNFTVIEFNFLWLGGAYIELRIMTEFGFITVHSYIYAGTSQNTFIQSPNQPVRYEIRSTTGSGSFRYICNQVASAGSINESGFAKSVNTGTAFIPLGASGTTYPILGLRHQSSAYRSNPIKLRLATGIVSTQNNVIRWTLQINPTLSGALTWNNVPNSAAAYAVNTAGAITVTASGIVSLSGFLSQGGQIHPEVFTNNFLSWLSDSITGTPDSYIFCATPIGNNMSVGASIIYLEA